MIQKNSGYVFITSMIVMLSLASLVILSWQNLIVFIKLGAQEDIYLQVPKTLPKIEQSCLITPSKSILNTLKSKLACKKGRLRYLIEDLGVYKCLSIDNKFGVHVYRYSAILSNSFIQMNFAQQSNLIPECHAPLNNIKPGLMSLVINTIDGQ